MWSVAVGSQEDLAGRMAGELCHCITRADAQTLRDRPELCLKRISGRYATEVAEEWQLDATSDRGRRALLDELAATLAENCTKLRDYADEHRYRLRWSDVPEEQPFRYRAPILRERRKQTHIPGPYGQVQTFVGRLSGIAGNELRLTNEEGETVLFLPPRFSPRFNWEAGARYRIRCHRRLVEEDSRVAWVVVEVGPA